jgi:hypothetical protein
MKTPAASRCLTATCGGRCKIQRRGQESLEPHPSDCCNLRKRRQCSGLSCRRFSGQSTTPSRNRTRDRYKNATNARRHSFPSHSIANPLPILYALLFTLIKHPPTPADPRRVRRRLSGFRFGYACAPARQPKRGRTSIIYSPHLTLITPGTKNGGTSPFLPMSANSFHWSSPPRHFTP